jgi:predicted nucleic acid-binding protein
MGEGGPIAVADAGPLIHLYEVGRLWVLKVFSALHIPDGVWKEVVGASLVPEDAIVPAMPLSRHPVTAAEIPQHVSPADRHQLQQGELEALTLCRLLDVPLLLTDDLAARTAAQRMRIRPVGSVGIVVKAYHSSLISLRDRGGT